MPCPIMHVSQVRGRDCRIWYTSCFTSGSMNLHLTRSALKILMESPLYPAMSLKERCRLIRDFMALYAPLVEDPGERVADGQAESMPTE